MKKVLFLFSGLFFLSFLSNAQQDKDTKNKYNSLTISFAPSYFSVPEIGLYSKTFCPTSFYVTGNFIIKNRLGFSTGLHLLHIKNVENFTVISEYGYSGPASVRYGYNTFDMPLRLNYHIIKPNDKINFYLKTEVHNSMIVKYTEEYPGSSGKNESNIESGYNLFVGFGCGLDFKVLDRLSVAIEPNKIYSVRGVLSPYGRIECQFGIKYKLKK